MLKDKLQILLGSHFRSTSWGLITIVAIVMGWVINETPTLVSFLPDQAEVYVVGISHLVAAVSSVFFALSCADCKAVKTIDEPQDKLLEQAKSEQVTSKVEDKKV